jgi:hypothetical protein
MHAHSQAHERRFSIGFQRHRGRKADASRRSRMLAFRAEREISGLATCIDCGLAEEIGRENAQKAHK